MRDRYGGRTSHKTALEVQWKLEKGEKKIWLLWMKERNDANLHTGGHASCCVLEKLNSLARTSPHPLRPALSSSFLSSNFRGVEISKSPFSLVFKNSPMSTIFFNSDHFYRRLTCNLYIFYWLFQLFFFTERNIICRCLRDWKVRVGFLEQKNCLQASQFEESIEGPNSPSERESI